MSFKHLHQMRCIACALDSRRLRCSNFPVGVPLANAAPVPAKSSDDTEDHDTHQTCDRDHRRKPELRSRVCHVHAEKRTNGVEPSFRRNLNKDGTPGPNFPQAQQFAAVDQGATNSRRSVFAESTEIGIPEQYAAGPAGGRSQ